MPQVTVYVRNDDLDKWKALPNKAERISQMLNESEVPSGGFSARATIPVFEDPIIPVHMEPTRPELRDATPEEIVHLQEDSEDYETFVEYPINQAGYKFYHDGTRWVKTSPL